MDLYSITIEYQIVADPYQFLGVSSSASAEEIEREYTRLKQEYAGNEEAQRALNEAYEAIREDQKQRSRSETIQVECVRCGRLLNVQTEQVLDIGRENLVCMECANRDKRPQTNSGRSTSTSIGGFLKAAGKFVGDLAAPFILIWVAGMLLQAYDPALLTRELYGIWLGVAALYLLFVTERRNSWIFGAASVFTALTTIRLFVN